MTARLLLDTHIVVRWLGHPRKLSREQMRALRSSLDRQETLGISGISLMEIGLLFGRAPGRDGTAANRIFQQISENPVFEIISFNLEVAREFAAMGDGLRDPADRAIVSTARVHGLRLVTSDERIIGSRLVPVID